jgi:hypothetical protein
MTSEAGQLRDKRGGDRIEVSSFLTMGFLIGEPEAPRTLPAEPADDYFFAEASMNLERRDGVDAGVVVVTVMPVKVFCGTGDGWTAVQELTRVFR